MSLLFQNVLKEIQESKKELEISFQDWTEDEVQLILLHLKNSPNQIKSLCFGNLPRYAVQPLGNVLLENYLQKLYLSGNHIGDSGAKVIGDMLQVNSSLQVIDLNSNLISDIGVLSLSHALRRPSCNIIEFLLAVNRVSDQGARSLAESLLENQSLISLNLGVNEIGDIGATFLGTALLSNRTLKELYLSGNLIGDHGASSLASSFETNASVRVIFDLGFNRIQNHGAKSFANTIKQYHGLEILYLDQNQIEEDGGEALLESIKVNVSLKDLKLEDNLFSLELEKKFNKILNLRRSVEVLNILSLCSIRTIPRLGNRSFIRILPIELMKRLALFLIL